VDFPICPKTTLSSRILVHVFSSPTGYQNPIQKTNGKPFIDLGFVVEDELQANDVRLTMGGEPTFVS